MVEVQFRSLSSGYKRSELRLAYIGATDKGKERRKAEERVRLDHLDFLPKSCL
jgi:hypothetical protein